MNKRKEQFTNIQIKKSQKKPLEKASYDLSSEFEERIPMTRILSVLLDNYLDDAKQIIRDEMNFVGK